MKASFQRITDLKDPLWVKHRLHKYHLVIYLLHERTPNPNAS